MKKIFAIALVALSVAGCNSNNKGDRALVGGALGAATGATIAAVAGGGAGAVVASSVVGGAAGAIIGSETAPRCVNQYNERVPCP
ncbi:bacteriocin [Acuticoccus yangtzensis]|uniref:bacteriocin n=1 Tax=Acuticoccus yangtzensis TaxID=1443441 RepID=UPI000949960E|nr:bacteriocin [Acuticoccus yangtzensis]